jgi:hypothetical protein
VPGAGLPAPGAAKDHIRALCICCCRAGEFVGGDKDPDEQSFDAVVQCLLDGSVTSAQQWLSQLGTTSVCPASGSASGDPYEELLRRVAEESHARVGEPSLLKSVSRALLESNVPLPPCDTTLTLCTHGEALNHQVLCSKKKRCRRVACTARSPCRKALRFTKSRCCFQLVIDGKPSEHIGENCTW